MTSNAIISSHYDRIDFQNENVEFIPSFGYTDFKNKIKISEISQSPPSEMSSCSVESKRRRIRYDQKRTARTNDYGHCLPKEIDVERFWPFVLRIFMKLLIYIVVHRGRPVQTRTISVAL